MVPFFMFDCTFYTSKSIMGMVDENDVFVEHDLLCASLLFFFNLCSALTWVPKEALILLPLFTISTAYMIFYFRIFVFNLFIYEGIVSLKVLRYVGSNQKGFFKSGQ